MLRQKQDEIAIPVGEPVNLCEELFAILLRDDRKQGLCANLGGVALGIDGADIHDGDRGLVLQHHPRMGDGLLDDGAALLEERLKSSSAHPSSGTRGHFPARASGLQVEWESSQHDAPGNHYHARNGPGQWTDDRVSPDSDIC